MQKLKDLTKEELIERISNLEKRSKFGINWENKTEKIIEDCKTNFPILKLNTKETVQNKKFFSSDIFIEGDNYHSLAILNVTHREKIDFIYIDPPYNTGARDWKYNNDYIDIHDSYRHSKWLSFMSERLILCKDLLKNNGIICVTIDDNELSRLWLLLEKIFGERNFLGNVSIRNNPKGRPSEKRKFSLTNEYAIFFGKSLDSKINKIPIDPESKSHNYKKINDEWILPTNLRKMGTDSSWKNSKGKISHRYYPVYYSPKNKKISVTNKYEIEIFPIDESGEKRIWKCSKEDIEKLFNDGEIWVKKVKDKYQLYYKFRGGLDGERPQTIWIDKKFSASDNGTKELEKILGAREQFNFPKSRHAVMQCIKSATNNKNAVILDFFAGSGTTGHAVDSLNAEDGGNRNYILCTNNENNIATNVCLPRLKFSNKELSKKNLICFTTDFFEIKKSLIDTKYSLKREIELMISLKENIYSKPIHKKNEFSIYKNQEKILGIIYNVEKINSFKKLINKNKTNISIYIFSISNDNFEEEFSEFSNIKIEPIPERVLNIYQKIFKI